MLAAASLSLAVFAQADAKALVTNQKSAEQNLWTQTLPKQLTYIQDGHGGPVIYDFQDPNCPYCHALYENEAPLVREGKLTVRYVPVAILTPESTGEAAAWLSSPHPVQTLQHFETIVGSAFQTRDFSHLPHSQVTAKIRQELQENKKIFVELGFDGTPALLFRAKNGQLGTIPGYMTASQLRQLIPDLRVNPS
jgi:thiol:disulfide interchange protein DsbG